MYCFIYEFTPCLLNSAGSNSYCAFLCRLLWKILRHMKETFLQDALSILLDIGS